MRAGGRDAVARGRQIGTACSREIRESIAIYTETFHHYANLDWTDATAFAERFRAPIADYKPTLLAEMEGIAAGAGVDTADILALNARSEIMFGLSRLPATECTAFFVGAEVTRAQRPLLGQNWDWRGRAAGSIVLTEFDATSETPAFLMLAEAGLVGKVGFNEAGVGFAMNSMTSSLDRAEPAVPIHVVMRAMLEATTLEEAVAAVVGTQRGASANYLLADSSGHAVNLETAPGGVSTVSLSHPVDEILTHANHFTSCQEFEDLGVRRQPDSIDRVSLMRELIESDRGSVTTASMEEVLRSHAGLPGAICRHEDETRHAVERSRTVASWVVDLERGIADVALGNPCEAKYERVVPSFSAASRSAA